LFYFWGVFMTILVGRCIRCGKKVFVSDDFYVCGKKHIFCGICSVKLHMKCPICSSSLGEYVVGG
jgi:hypothetical protein